VGPKRVQKGDDGEGGHLFSSNRTEARRPREKRGKHRNRAAMKRQINNHSQAPYEYSRKNTGGENTLVVKNKHYRKEKKKGRAGKKESKTTVWCGSSETRETRESCFSQVTSFGPSLGGKEGENPPGESGGEGIMKAQGEKVPLTNRRRKA